jgi:hypothetical protein
MLEMCFHATLSPSQNISLMSIIPGPLAFIGQNLVSGLNSSEELGSTFDVTIVAVRM